MHTKGPWVRAPKRLLESIIIESITGEQIATVLDLSPFGHDNETEANADLIAAAPKLLDALIKLRLEAMHYLQSGKGAEFLSTEIQRSLDIECKAKGLLT